MNSSFHAPFRNRLNARLGFSLIEVILAIGIFLVTILALVGLMGPTLKSVDEIEKTDEVASIVNTINAFLQSSPDIATGPSKFDEIYNAVQNDGYATIFAFRQFADPNNITSVTDINLQIGFWGETGATISATDVATLADGIKAAGPVYRAVLTPSSVIPAQYLVGGSPVTRNSNGVYTLNTAIAGYDEGYFAMEVRIYAEDPSIDFNGGNLPPYSGAAALPANLTNLRDIEPIFTYNTAIVR